MILDAQIPAYESCARCGRGDTTTAFGVRGSALFHCAVMMRVCGWTREEAMASVVQDIEAHGGDPKETPEWMEGCVRLCTNCADATGVKVKAFDSSDSFHALPGLEEA